MSEVVELRETIGELHTAEEYRDMFIGAIAIQEQIKVQADNMIAHYEYALSELAKQQETVK
jgi:hypothetical protein